MRGNDRSMIRALRGPVTLITLGVLFALNNFTPYRFEQTWPILLIVFGLMSLLRRGVEDRPAPIGTWASSTPNAPPYVDTRTSGSYAQGPYAQAPQPLAGPPATSRGGFGTTAPPRAPEPGEQGNPSGGGL